MKKERTIIINRSKHTISRKDIDPDALSVLRHLNRHGHKAYLVGGGVRDILIGRQPKDFDISTDADPARIKRLFRNCFLVGRRFRLAHIRFGRNKVIETSTFRKPPETDTTTDTSLIQWDDNSFGTPAEDARRRDFTINALFYDLSDFSLIDHVGGLHDLRKGVIRCIGNPDIRFREDPVRMIRAVRFAARLGFRIEKNTYKAILQHHAEISQASPARLLEEVYKLFDFHSSEAAFRLLWELKLLAVLLPELAGYLNKNGKEDAPVWRHLSALDSGQFTDGYLDQSFMLATLLCDPVFKILEKSNSCTHAEHLQQIESWMQPFCLRFKVPKSVRYRMMRLFDNQIRMDQAFAINGSSGKRKKTFIKRLIQHPSFPLSLALFEIRVSSGCANSKVLERWQTATKEQPPSMATQPDRLPEKPANKRRRRRRKKPSHVPSNS